MRYMCVVSYDGTRYAGYQKQLNAAVTIQATIEKALAKIHKGEKVETTASGRTDAGVHAKGQTFHFNSSLALPEQNWARALNAVLPDDIVVVKVSEVAEDFHARYHVTAKTYHYVVLNQKELDPFQRNYCFHVKEKLDLEQMQTACQLLMGKHDFTAFCTAKTGVKGSKVRELYHVSCQEQYGKIVFTFTGKGFMYNMVRILVGTLLEIGRGKRSAEDIPTIIASKERSQAGQTAPAHGLYLTEVRYH